MLKKKIAKNKCYNKRCGAYQGINKNACRLHLCDCPIVCEKFVSFENRKSVNKPTTFNLSKEFKLPVFNKQDNSYTFRGEINTDHLINDCLKDNKNTFLAISKRKAIIGISKQLKIKDKSKFFNQLTDPWEDDVQKAFYVIYINKKDIPLAVQKLNKISKKLRNKAMNTAKKLRKATLAGKFSKMPETKVMVF